MVQARIANQELTALAAELPADVSILIPLYEGYRAASDAMLAIVNKPRATRACDAIDDEIELLNSKACAVASRLRSLTEIDQYWDQMYLETMMSHHFFVGGSPAEALTVLADFQKIRLTKKTAAH